MYSLVWYCTRSGILCFLLKCIGIEITKGASTVVPCFLPFVAAVRESREDPHLLHGPVGNRHQALNPGHLYVRAAVSKNRKASRRRWKPAGNSHHARVDMLEVEANRQQPVGGSRKPAGLCFVPFCSQRRDGCQQATTSRRERTDKLTRESRKPAGDRHQQQPVGGSRKPAGESQQVEDGCRQATGSRQERENGQAR